MESGNGTDTSEYGKGSSDRTVTDIFQVDNIEEEAYNENKDDLVDA